MKLFEKTDEPKTFKEECEEPGEEWLAKHPRGKDKRRVKDFWSPFKPALADEFQNLCGYCFMLDSTGGTIDHYISCDTDESLAYKWTNYRFAWALLNQIKQNEDDRVLDPFDADDEWFEILLPSMQMVMTDKVPDPMKAKVAHTLERLRLIDDERIIRHRRMWHKEYEEGRLTLEGLRRFAPLVAKAVEKNLR